MSQRQGSATPRNDGGFGSPGPEPALPRREPVRPEEVQEHMYVPFEDKDEVKLAGARFDGDKKMWSAGTSGHSCRRHRKRRSRATASRPA